MRTTRILAVVIGLLLSSLQAALSQEPELSQFPGLGPAGELQAIEFEAAGDPVLRGVNARMQLVVTGRFASGQFHDVTHDVEYSVDHPAILTVDEDGVVTPLSDGTATITATAADGQTAALQLTAERCSEQLPINFANEIVPLFTKLGCNTGGCHGKADGQNGFKLSLLGFYPDEDYEYLVLEDRGRRIFPADPAYSLLLMKPSNQLPHGGGHRLSPGSYEWNLIKNWIEQGLPYGSEDDPVLSSIEVFPKSRKMNRREKQQLRVIGHYSDGTTRDVSQLATYESNDEEMAVASAFGRVTTDDIPGEVAVMVRFQGAVSVFRAIIPQGLPVEEIAGLSEPIDVHVFAKLKELGIPPSPVCDDQTFVRRVTVDIAGRLPTAVEARQFAADSDPDKRNKLIDRLLAGEGYGDYFANKWSAVLRNKRRNANDIPYTYRFHAWIRSAMQQNMPYDEFVRNILAATGDVESHPPVAWYREVRTNEQRMEDTAQLFLGLRLGCAKCHHHPFERWSQSDYYGFQAFFSQVAMKQSRLNTVRNIVDYVSLNGQAPTARNPRTQTDVLPTGLGGEPIEVPPYEDARHYMVDWMTAPDNPFFARALVNRYWKHFFGRGIVDPEDDMRVTNPPSNPALLDALAQHFIDSGFDLKNLVRTICRSRTYQLSSEPNEFNYRDKQNYSSFYPRRLTAEVLYDAVNQVSGTTSGFGGVPRGTLAVQLPDNGFNDYFLQVFGKPEAESACECERNPEANLAQSLHLLNSTDIQSRVANNTGRAALFARDQTRFDAESVTELYYWAYARPPRPEELDFVLGQIALYENKQQAYEDVLWAMFNSREFQFVR
ncbi:MAG: DUF1549 domain-containing protein [Planctomycetota bacterium]|nr:MAG: DUF1549 domain-containing protein [Planctomycetota bacterium]